MKKIVKITLSVILCMSLIVGCGKKKEEEKEETNRGNVNINTEEGVIGEQVIEETFKFENTKLTYDGEKTRIETRVTNITEEEKTIVEFRIHVIKEDKEIANLPGYVGSVIKAGEEKILTTTYGMDLTKATKIEYEIVR